MRKHKTLTLIIFLTLGLFNYTSNANSLKIALFLPFDSSSYSEMAESIHNGINDSLNNFNLNSRIERFNESNSLKDNLLTFKKINSKKEAVKNLPNLLFLKGKTFEEELNDIPENLKIKFQTFPSITSAESRILLYSKDIL